MRNSGTVRIAAVLPMLLLVPAAIFAPADAASQTIPSHYRFIDTRHNVGVVVGLLAENRGELDLGPHGSTLLGLRYGIELGGPFALEATSFVIPGDREVFDPSDPEAGLLHVGNTDALVIGLDGRVRFTFTGARTWRGLAPFVLAGGGLVGDLQGRSSLEEDLEGEERFSFGPSFLGTLGAGTRWLPTDRVTLRLESVLHIWKLSTPRAYFQFEEQAGSIPQQEWTGITSILLGASIRF